MAVVTSGNVHSMAANGDTIARAIRVEEINIQAGAAGATIRLRKGVVGGAVLFEAVLAANENKNYSSRLRIPNAGVYLEIAAGAATVYLYSE